MLAFMNGEENPQSIFDARLWINLNKYIYINKLHTRLYKAKNGKQTVKMIQSLYKPKAPGWTPGADGLLIGNYALTQDRCLKPGCYTQSE